jgi:hypothetical protein
MRSSCWLCLCILLINFWMLESIFMKLRMLYVIASEPISTVYFINLSQQSEYICIRPGSVKIYRGNEYTCNNRTVGPVVSYAAHIVRKES